MCVILKFLVTDAIYGGAAEFLQTRSLLHPVVWHHFALPCYASSSALGGKEGVGRGGIGHINWAGDAFPSPQHS